MCKITDTVCKISDAACVNSACVDGSEYRYLGTGFNIFTRWSTTHEHLGRVSHPGATDLWQAPSTRILNPWVSPSGSPLPVVLCGPHSSFLPRLYSSPSQVVQKSSIFWFLIFITTLFYLFIYHQQATLVSCWILGFRLLNKRREEIRSLQPDVSHQVVTQHLWI